ncbi:MAG: CerR family C-terminal domain-containing protein [Phyllobacterium sp.]
MQALLPSAQATRGALIQAGLELFGENGFAATSTRDVAHRAQANIGSIAYHFGGKAGLHQACAQFCIDTLSTLVGPAWEEMPNEALARLSPDEATQRLTGLIDIFASFLVLSPAAESIARFMLREITQPSDTLDVIYGNLVEPTHKRLCILWARATGAEAEAVQTKLSVFAMIGQILYFRLGRDIVRRRMEWTVIGKEEAAAIAVVLKANVLAAIARDRGGAS